MFFSTLNITKNICDDDDDGNDVDDYVALCVCECVNVKIIFSFFFTFSPLFLNLFRVPLPMPFYVVAFELSGCRVSNFDLARLFAEKRLLETWQRRNFFYFRGLEKQKTTSRRTFLLLCACLVRFSGAFCFDWARSRRDQILATRLCSIECVCAHQITK